MKWLILVLEAIILSAIFWYKGPSEIFAAFLIPIAYFLIGLIHGQLFEDKIKACLMILAVGATAGLIMTLAGYHITTRGVNPIGKVWVIEVLVNNVVAYSTNILGLLEALVGVFVSHKILGSLVFKSNKGTNSWLDS
jgi:hypothetical protein